MPVLSVVLPCFNEAGNVPRLEAELFPELDKLALDYEVLAVDDGSSDSTLQALQDLSSRQPKLRVLKHPANLGLGAALKTGLRGATGDWLVFLDADMTFHPRHIRDLWEEKDRSAADCVSGSPHLCGMKEVPLARRLPSLAMNAFYRGLFGRAPTSYTPMFRLYRTGRLRSLELLSDGFEVSAEILVRLLKSGARVVEVPVPLAVRTQGASKMRNLRELGRHLRLIARLLAA